MKKLLLIPALLLIAQFCLSGQGQQYKVGCIGFYNLENLFDTLDTPGVRDTEFTPTGANRYDTRVYLEKLDNLARVVSELGTDLTPDGVAVLGVAEIENRKVLEDFVFHPRIKDRNYEIVHYDSPDERGIDVALLYQPRYFQVTGSRAIPLLIYEGNGERNFTRDVLYVSGLFDGEPLHILVNHWPSRSGGEAATQPYRNAAAMLCKNVCDSLTQIDPNARIILMGDLNDDPTSPSVRKVLQANHKKKEVQPGGLFNPMYDFYKKGVGTLAYRDTWNLFDQIILSYGLINPQAGGYRFYQAHIHNKPYMVQKMGHFQGYPFRTYGGNTYLGGYSDHFPVYVYLIKAIQQASEN